MAKKIAGEATDTSTFVITLRDEEKRILDEFIYAYIVNTHDVNISRSTLGRRIILEYVLKYADNERQPLTLERVESSKQDFLKKKK